MPLNPSPLEDILTLKSSNKKSCLLLHKCSRNLGSFQEDDIC